MTTGLITQPTNKNILQTNKWNFSIPEMPHLVYMVQSVVVPGVSTGPVLVPNPFSDTYRHGDKLVYEPLVVTFLVDEDLKVWDETYKWMSGITYPVDHQQYRNQKKKFLYADATLDFVTNNYTTNFQMKFYNCFPTSLGAISMNYTDDPNVVPSTDVTFQYDRFEFVR